MVINTSQYQNLHHHINSSRLSSTPNINKWTSLSLIFSWNSITEFTSIKYLAWLTKLKLTIYLSNCGGFAESSHNSQTFNNGGQHDQTMKNVRTPYHPLWNKHPIVNNPPLPRFSIQKLELSAMVLLPSRFALASPLLIP